MTTNRTHGPHDKKALAPIEDVRITLDRMKGEIQTALPPHIKADKFIRVTLTALRTNPYLLNLNRQSFFGACMRGAQLGLLPDGKEGAIAPFKDQAQWMTMIGGLCKLARNSGEIQSIDAQVVYQNDQYDAWTDEKGPHFRHKRSYGDRGTISLTYAYAITKDGGFFFEEIDEKQMAKIEACAKSKNVWQQWPEEMRRKSALRRLAKYRLPSSTDLDEALKHEDEFYELNQQESVPQEPQKKPRKLASLIGKKVEQIPKDVEEPDVEIAPEPEFNEEPDQQQQPF